jgi:outer membrane immunogenic protein
MRKESLASAAMMVLAGSVLAGSAMAADLPARPIYKAPPVVPPAFSWTGCFVGGNVGGVWVDKDYTLTTTGADAGSHDASSWLAGVQGGCDYQFNGRFVVGIQVDYDWMDASASHIDPVIAGRTYSSTTKSLGSVTGRIGYTWDRFLGYVRGGWAWERDNYSLVSPAIAGGALIPGFNAFTNDTRGGWTIGVGGEYAFTNALSGFIEYDYYDFGTRAIGFVNTANTATVNYDIDERKSVIKGGLNFRFNAGPIVARY